MGVSLHIQRVDGREGDLPSTDISTSIEMFNSIPWKEEMSHWETVPEEESELRRPLFQLFDDCGHALHITAYSDQLIGLAYNFPSASSPFGENEEGYIGTEQYPRTEIDILFECFFTSDTQAMLSLLEKYPTLIQPEEP
jgi:hypothetical protein